MRKTIILPLLNRDIIPGLLLAAAVLVAYRPVWNGSPVWDDDAHMVSIEQRSLDGLANLWKLPKGPVQYFPLVHTVFWLQANLWGNAKAKPRSPAAVFFYYSAMLLPYC